MKKYRPLHAFIFFSLVAVSTGAQPIAFSKIYKPGYNLFVFAPSGLSLRDKPDLKGARIKLVPYGKYVIVQKDENAPVPITNENIEGHWVKVKYEDKVGYLFDGFLSRLYPVRENETIETYLESIATRVSTGNQPPDTVVADFAYFKKTIYENGMTFSIWTHTDGRSYRLVTLEASMISLQEAYLLASSLMPFYFKDNGCPFNATRVFCEKEFASVEIKKEGKNFIILEKMAD